MATRMEIYNQIISYLALQCKNKQGRFLERQSNDFTFAAPFEKNVCAYTRTDTGTTASHYVGWLEDICPAKYQEMVDTASWGMCSCWHNGGRRSRNGITETCLPILPVVYAKYIDNMPIARPPFNLSHGDWLAKDENGNFVLNYDTKINDAPCSTVIFAPNPNGFSIQADNPPNKVTIDTEGNILHIPMNARKIPATAVLYSDQDNRKQTEYWCTQDAISDNNQVCSYTGLTDEGKCKKVKNNYEEIDVSSLVPNGI